MDPLDCVKPAIRAMRAYTLPPRAAQVKVNQNENPFELSDEFKRDALERMAKADWARYPDFVPQGLLEALARFAGWRADGVLAGNGSNELIDVLLKATVGDGVAVVIPQPTFTLYANMTTALGGTPVSVPLTADLRFDVDAMLAAGRAREAKVIIICSPNNPTGTLLPGAELLRVLREWPGLVVVDEAYHEFSRGSVVPLLADHPRLVVLRTFSKAMAMAGLRVGYLLGHPALVKELDKVRLPYNLNRFSTIAATMALERYDEVLAPSVERLIELRDRLADELAGIPGVEVAPSWANFLLIRTPWPPKQVFEALFAAGVLARDVSSYPMLHDRLRLSVGTAEENARAVAALQAFARQQQDPMRWSR